MKSTQKNINLYNKVEITKNLKYLLTTLLMQEVQSGHVPSFLSFAKSAMQNSYMQPRVFLVKTKDQQSLCI